MTIRWERGEKDAFLLHLALLLPEQTLSLLLGPPSLRSSSSSSSYYPASCYGVKRSLSNGPTLLCEVGRGRRSWGLGGRRTDGGAPNDVDGETGIHFEGGGGVTDASLFWGRGCEKLTLRFPLINKGFSYPLGYPAGRQAGSHFVFGRQILAGVGPGAKKARGVQRRR